jgi:hypothetical protein
MKTDANSKTSQQERRPSPPNDRGTNDLMVQPPAKQQLSSGTPLELTTNNFVERQK